MSTKVKCSHYGEPVDTLIQSFRYEDVLDENGIKYETQPILVKGIRILKYNGKYAAIKDLPSFDETNELVCVFDKMPDDLDIAKLCDDVLMQRNGESPVRKPSIFRKIFDEGELRARREYLAKADESEHFNIILNLDFPEDDEFFRIVSDQFITYGYYKKEQVSKLPHDDCDEDSFKEVISKMFQ